MLRDIADKIDAGNSELTEEEAMDLASVFCHEAISKDQACSYLGIKRSWFDNLIRQGKMPRGRKLRGYNELRWYRDEIETCSKKIKSESHFK